MKALGFLEVLTPLVEICGRYEFHQPLPALNFRSSRPSPSRLRCIYKSLRVAPQAFDTPNPLKKTRTAKFAREVVSQELPSKLQDFDGIVVVQCD